MTFRLLLLLSFFSATFLTLKPAFAGETLWDVIIGDLFSEPETGPKPEDTLQAPFSYGTAIDLEQDAGQAKNSALAHPHHGEREISEMVVTYVSEVLNYKATPNSAEEEFEKRRIYFSPGGYQQYMEFLQSNNIKKVIESGRFHIKSFVEDSPLLLNAIASEGRYRWLYEIPIMISYMDAKNFDYRENEPINQKITLTVQVGRVDDPEDTDGIVIETWSGKTQKIEKKQSQEK